MGLTPTPYEYGDDCWFCWGPLGRWPNEHTPKFVNMTVAGLGGGCAGANGTFTAQQVLLSPCNWRFDSGNVHGTWRVMPGGGHVQIWEAPGCGLCLDIADFDFCPTHFEFGGATVDIS